LHLDSSADATTSTSRALTAEFAAAWTAANAQNTITYRDLRIDAPPHLPDASLHYGPAVRDPDARPPADAIAWQDLLLAELFAADVVLIGAPLYNWSIPSSLKAWIDYVHVMGVTATSDRPPPLKGRPAIVVSARGAAYGEGAQMAGWDHEIPALKIVLGISMGMAVSAITAELTLAEQVPELAGFREQAAADLAKARAAVIEAADRLGRLQ
jgi:FMN-dependent NADH-azoreductase